MWELWRWTARPYLERRVSGKMGPPTHTYSPRAKGQTELQSYYRFLLEREVKGKAEFY